jgi:hypothetical protein
MTTRMRGDDDEGNAVTPPAPAPAAVPKEIVEEEAPVEMVMWTSTPVIHPHQHIIRFLVRLLRLMRAN